MRSIRLSLVVYFLLLQAAALGAAAWLVHYTAGESLQSEQDLHQKLLARQYAESVDKERAQFDEELLRKARALAEVAQPQFQGRRLESAPFLSLGILTACVAANGQLLAPAWVASGTCTPLHAQLLQQLAAEIVVSENMLPHDHDSAMEDYFQINSEWGAIWHSHNFDSDQSYPIDRELFEGGKTTVYLDLTTPNGNRARCVQLKTPVLSRLPIPRMQPDAAGRSTAAANDLPRAGQRPERMTSSVTMPWIVVHCISETRRRDAILTNLNAELAKKQIRLLVDSTDANERLLIRLGGIGLLTFAATVIGGSLIVGYGLAPLRRLTEAVSKVTPRDIKLPLDDKKLPRELDPIATRLQATLDELRRAFEREKQAVADMSHELRTPVAALLATVEVALRKPRSADEYRKTLVDARNIGKQMRELVERLLALARLDAGVAKVQSGTVDVADLVEQCATLVRPLAVANDLTLTAHAPPHLPWFTDGDKLREVLINLLNNAVQYNAPGGTVSVTVTASGAQLELAVSDTGIGIAADAIPHLFERFYRVDPSREASELNAGLGLSIVRGYVDLLGGNVEVTSTLGKGTTFRITLPELNTDRSREAA